MDVLSPAHGGFNYLLSRAPSGRDFILTSHRMHEPGWAGQCNAGSNMVRNLGKNPSSDYEPTSGLRDCLAHLAAFPFFFFFLFFFLSFFLFFGASRCPVHAGRHQPNITGRISLQYSSLLHTAVLGREHNYYQRSLQREWRRSLELFRRRPFSPVPKTPLLARSAH